MKPDRLLDNDSAIFGPGWGGVWGIFGAVSVGGVWGMFAGEKEGRGGLQETGNRADFSRATVGSSTENKHPPRQALTRYSTTTSSHYTGQTMLYPSLFNFPQLFLTLWYFYLSQPAIFLTCL